MALLHVYNGINSKKTYEISGRLGDNDVGIDWKNSVLLKSGYRINSDYVVKSDDIIFARLAPSAATTVSTVLAVTAIVAVVAGGVAVGVTMYNQQQELKKLEQEQQKAKATSKAAASGTGKLPFIRGARNQIATGHTIPYAIGESLMTPYMLVSPHYTIAGERGDKQYYNCVLQVAYSNILIKKLKMGETVIKDFSSSTGPQSGSFSWDDGVYYDANNKIEIRQSGNFSDSEFNKKIKLTEINKEIPHDHASDNATENERIENEWQQGVVQELPNCAMSVQLLIMFDGLQNYNTESGTWEKRSVTLQPQWTNVNNPTENDWNNFTNGFLQQSTYNNTFNYNTNQQMRFTATQSFSAAQAYGKNIKIRLRRTTPKTTGTAKENVYLVAVQTTCYSETASTSTLLVASPLLDATTRDKCCRIGIRVAANANTDGMLDAFSVVESACARTWTGSAWTQARVPTRNLAAWALEILTNSIHSASRYNDSELDLASFGAWYDYCETEGFYADGVITQSTRKKDVLDRLCLNGNAALVYNNISGKMEVVIDNGRDYSVALLNSENIIGISTTKQFKRKIDGKKVTYINAAADYDIDSVIFMRDGGSYDPSSDKLTETALEFVTSYEHAYKIAWRQMAEELAQPRIITVRAGRESAYYPIYSRVELQHKSLKIGLAHGIIKTLVWNNSYLSKIILDGSVTFPTGQNCGVLINCVSSAGHGILALKVSGTGKTNELTVTTTLRNNANLIPSAGNLLSFGVLDSDGEFSTVTSSMKITNAEETDDGYTLTLVDYNPDIYEYGTLPEYKSNITKTPNGRAVTVQEQRPYVDPSDVLANAAESAQAAIDTVTKNVRFTNVYKLRNVPISLEDIIAKMDDDARNSSASISMSSEEILLKVESLDAQQRAFIALTKDQILAQVDDMAEELTGLIGIQAGAVTAMVEGGGAAGQMSLSLNLPVMIDATKRAALVTASTEAKVAAVYAAVTGTDYYGIKDDASNADVKALWDDAVTAGLLASQVIISADQLNIAGKTIYTSSKTDTVASNAQSDAQTNIAQKLGYASYPAMVQAAQENKTIIDGGYLRTALIDVENILVKNISVKDKGVLHSSNYNGTIDSNGNITAYGSTGWAIDHGGTADLYGLHATAAIMDQGIFNEGIFNNISFSGSLNAAKYAPDSSGRFVNLSGKGGLLFITSQERVGSTGRFYTGLAVIFYWTSTTVVSGQTRNTLSYQTIWKDSSISLSIVTISDQFSQYQTFQITDTYSGSRTISYTYLEVL